MKYTSNTIRINIFFIICIVLLFVIFFAKLAYVGLSTVVEDTNLRELAENRSIATKTLVARRGKIFDNAGELLAQNVNSYTVIAYLSSSRTTDERYPKHVVDKKMTAEKLSEVLYPLNNKMTVELIEGLLNMDKYQVELGPGGRGITENVKRKIEALALPGIDFEKTDKRYYQKGDFASYIIGYAKKYTEGDTEKTVGELGIEEYCDRYLKGTNGTITYQKDAYGYQLADRDYYIEEAKDGYDVYLTIDSNVQMFLDNAVIEFKKYLKDIDKNPKDLADYEKDWVSITIADAKTGAIIGSSSSPSFNPNKLNIVDYKNPLTSYTYEPGSTMKIFSFMSAIEEGKYKGDELYKSGTIPVDNYVINDWNKHGWGKITYDTGFTYSSNVAATKLAQRIGKKKLINYYNDLGFASKTGIELANELSGVINIDSETALATASYGQGIMVTPIQMIQALTSITNDGNVLKPYVIEKIVDPNNNEVVYQGKRREIKKVYSTSTVNKIIELMDLTVNGKDKVATGRVYQTDAVRLIGKTGTANYTKKSGGYVKGTYNNIRSFAGIFPKEDPEYIIYVAVKDFNGTSKHMGAIIKNLVESVAKYRNIDDRPSDKNEAKIVNIENYMSTSTISSVSKLKSYGIESVVIGDGDTVIKQYPAKGTKTLQDSKVFLLTNGKKITMPDMTGWSSVDVNNFCALTKIECTFNNYGYVKSTNLKESDIIDSTTNLIVDLKELEPVSLITSDKDNQDEGEDDEDE